MAKKRYLCVKNFDESQHYKDRNPIWIKMYCSMLDEYEFAQIPDETKFHAVGLMLLASRLNNRFPEDERWLRQKINANSEINLELLLEIGFLEIENEQKLKKKTRRSSAKKPSIARKSNKTKDDLASTTSELALAQNRTEQNRTDENTTEHNRRAAAEKTADAENGAVVCVDSESSKNKNSAEKNGQTENSENCANSQFSVSECLKYVSLCASKGDAIKNPHGLANHLYKTGSADAFILAALYPERQKDAELKIYGKPRKFSDEPCSICLGAKMADTDGKGYRKCEHCRNERGISTGFEPTDELRE